MLLALVQWNYSILCVCLLELITGIALSVQCTHVAFKCSLLGNWLALAENLACDLIISVLLLLALKLKVRKQKTDQRMTLQGLQYKDLCSLYCKGVKPGLCMLYLRLALIHGNSYLRALYIFVR